MPELKDIEEFKSLINNLGGEPEILASKGQEIDDVQPEESGVPEDISRLFSDTAGPEDNEMDSDLDVLPDFAQMTGDSSAEDAEEDDFFSSSDSASLTETDIDEATPEEDLVFDEIPADDFSLEEEPEENGFEPDEQPPEDDFSMEEDVFGEEAGIETGEETPPEGDFDSGVDDFLNALDDLPGDTDFSSEPAADIPEEEPAADDFSLEEPFSEEESDETDLDDISPDDFSMDEFSPEDTDESPGMDLEPDGEDFGDLDSFEDTDMIPEDGAPEDEFSLGDLEDFEAIRGTGDSR